MQVGDKIALIRQFFNACTSFSCNACILTHVTHFNMHSGVFKCAYIWTYVGM